MAFTVRGPPQLVRRIDDVDFTLHDPLLATVLDYDRRALDQLAHGLRLAVTCTYNHAEGIDKEKFFENRHHKCVDPSQDKGGQDVFYLLKNVEENANKYDKLLKQSEEDVKETAKFLRENIRNAMAHQTYLNCPSLSDQTSNASCVKNKSRTTKECLDKCAVLLQWIVYATFYQRIRKKVEKILSNIANMQAVFKEFLSVQQSMSDRKESSKNTKKAITLVEDMLVELRLEESWEEDKDRPLTHFANMVLAPRLKAPHDAISNSRRRRRRRRITRKRSNKH